MITRIIISKQALSSFRKLAIKSYPLEVMQTLWGRIEGSTAVVSSLRDLAHKSTEEKLDYDLSDVVEPISHTREQFLGSIHSHPNCEDSAPSSQDWQDAFACGEHVFGVMNVNPKPNGKSSTSTTFHEPRPDISIIHPRVRKPRKSTSPTPQEGSVQAEIATGEVPSSLDPS